MIYKIDGHGHFNLKTGRLSQQIFFFMNKNPIFIYLSMSDQAKFFFWHEYTTLWGLQYERFKLSKQTHNETHKLRWQQLMVYTTSGNNLFSIKITSNIVWYGMIKTHLEDV